jgi:hypothetical protein
MLSLVTLNVVMLNVANDALMLSLILLKVMLSAVAPLLSLAPPRSGYFFYLELGYLLLLLKLFLSCYLLLSLTELVS